MTPEQIDELRFKIWQHAIEDELKGQRRLLLIVVYGLVVVAACWAVALILQAV